MKSKQTKPIDMDFVDNVYGRMPNSFWLFIWDKFEKEITQMAIKFELRDDLYG